METNQLEGEGRIYQVLVKLLDGTHRFLNFTNPIIPTQSLKRQIETLTSVPSHLQLLLLHHHNPPTLLHDEENLPCGSSSGHFPAVVHLLLRLRGGKGGFGSLLRGSATKAGQKKTNNFDACRDMSGRRIRHVNAEKKFEEWKAEADERKLEKVAEEYIKKKSKEMAKKGKGNGNGAGAAVDEYVRKYREDSERCREEVERSVRESIKQALLGPKRKKGSSAEPDGPDSKRAKIWLGKQKLVDDDSDSSDEYDSEDEEYEDHNRSVVLDNGDHSDASEEAKGISESVTEDRHDMISSGSGASGSTSDEEKAVYEQSQEPDRSRGVQEEAATAIEPELGVVLEENEASNGSNHHQASGTEDVKVVGNSDSNEVMIEAAESLNTEKPLNFDEINSAAELEVFGMDRLKSELQARGLKCGGTLQERAARLFLLKTTPIEMIPKKLFVKK
ncbi:OLC1v1038390C1 [Oldenlandia corymbosa var. corymbosa]|uniref:OLC1v1038390C1 n=1 Tax=Oldenlandia corymbosa var. corymbosa TaxID=529605 RepID=A0AAV1D2R0_OLDCO|nr:OLC1v1038390C1 [Oldenlandia corymbosa var. corymbosa]